MLHRINESNKGIAVNAYSHHLIDPIRNPFISYCYCTNCGNVLLSYARIYHSTTKKDKY